MELMDLVSVDNGLLYALIVWILANQFRDHGCLKRLEGLVKGHLKLSE
jgi:hypothetical protein